MPASFYTRRGDEGFTGLLGEGRVAKEDARIEAIGTIDEVSAALGLARAHIHSPEGPALLLHIQRDLYGLMGEVAATPENAQRFHAIDGEKVAWLEAQVDALSKLVEIPREFIIPGDTVEGAFLDLARAIVRRAERRVADLFHRGDVTNPDLLRYLNRLSSLCFVLEMRENQIAGNSNITLAKSGDNK
jgi:cob(I)alamin adenosyltransferase